MRRGKDGKGIALLKLVAGVTGLDYTVLHDRIARWRLRKLRRILAVIAILAEEQERQQRQRVERSLYESSILLTGMYIERREFDLAWRSLWRAPPGLRHWEWGIMR
jgi:hypothetical protein